MDRFIGHGDSLIVGRILSMDNEACRCASKYQEGNGPNTKLQKSHGSIEQQVESPRSVAEETPGPEPTA